MDDITEQVRAAAGSNYQVVYCDPAWHFKANSGGKGDIKMGRNAGRHYDLMSLKDIAAIPVKDMIAPQAVCFMWITGPFLAIGAHIPIMKAWGFKPKAMGITWVKLRRKYQETDAGWKLPDFHVGLGLTTRKNCEYLIIGSRGKSLRQSRSVPELGIFPLMEHSRKPDQFRTRIEEYVGPGLKMAELFCREAPLGWDAYGNEVGKFA